MSKLNLSYSTETPMANTVPVEDIQRTFDSLEQKELRNIESYNQHLSDLNIDVGPNIEDQQYVNNIKDAFTQDISSYAEKGNMVYAGKKLQEHIQKAIKDKNLINLTQSWHEVKAITEDTRNNKAIQTSHRSAFINNTNQMYKADVDLETGVYQSFNTPVPIEFVDTNKLVMDMIRPLEADAYSRARENFLDSAGNITDVTGAYFPFIFNKSTGEMQLSEQRVLGMARAAIGNNPEAMEYLVQDYVVKNPHLYKGQNISDVINAILNDEMEGSNEIKESLYNDLASDIAKNYKYKRTTDEESYRFVPGMNDGGGRGRDSNQGPNNLAWATTAGMNPGASFGTNTKELKEVINQNEQNTKSVIGNMMDSEKTKIRFGSSKISKDDLPALEEGLNYAVLNGDYELLNNIADELEYDPETKADLLELVRVNRQYEEIGRNKFKDARQIVIDDTPNPNIGTLISFNNDPDSKIHEILADVGVSTDMFYRIGTGSDAAAINSLVSAKPIIHSDFIRNKIDEFREYIDSRYVVGFNKDEIQQGKRPPAFSRLRTKAKDGREATLSRAELKGLEVLTKGKQFVESLISKGTTKEAAEVIREILLDGVEPGDFFRALEEVEKELDVLAGGSYKKELKKLDSQIDEQIKIQSENTTSHTATSLNFNSVLDSNEDQEHFKSVLQGALTESVDGKYIRGVVLYNSDGTIVSDKIADKISENANNIELLTIIPAPAIDGIPLVRISVTENKPGSQADEIHYANIKLDGETGITNNKIEAFKRSAPYLAMRDENLLSTYGVNKISGSVDGVEIYRGQTGNVFYMINGKKYNQPRGLAINTALIKQEQLAAQFSRLIDLSGISFDSNGLIDMDKEHAILTNLISAGVIDPNMLHSGSNNSDLTTISNILYQLQQEQQNVRKKFNIK